MMSLTLFFRRGRRSVMLACLLLFALGGCASATTTTPAASTGDTPTPTATTRVSPTPASIPGWQTYSDTNYPFAIQYPPAWTALPDAHLEGSPAYENVAFFPGSGKQLPTNNFIMMTIALESPDSGTDAAPPGFAPAGMVMVGGLEEPLLAASAADGTQRLLALLPEQGEIYLFSSQADTASAAAFQQTFTQMLSTFQTH